MTTVRLSNYQKKVLDGAKKQIDRARNCKSIYEYLTEVQHLNNKIINTLKMTNRKHYKCILIRGIMGKMLLYM